MDWLLDDSLGGSAAWHRSSLARDDHRRDALLGQSVDQVQTGRPMGQVEVGEDQIRRVLGAALEAVACTVDGSLDRVPLGAQHLLQIHGDKLLVLADQDVHPAHLLA